MEPGFIKADSGNLPLVDYVMIDKYYRNNPNFISAEVKNVKTHRSSRENYSDEAVGFVQLKRENQICIVKAKITPEHKIREKGYNVTVRIEENNEEIMDCVCHDCVAAAGSIPIPLMQLLDCLSQQGIYSSSYSMHDLFSRDIFRVTRHRLGVVMLLQCNKPDYNQALRKASRERFLDEIHAWLVIICADFVQNVPDALNLTLTTDLIIAASLVNETSTDESSTSGEKLTEKLNITCPINLPKKVFISDSFSKEVQVHKQPPKKLQKSSFIGPWYGELKNSKSFKESQVEFLPESSKMNINEEFGRLNASGTTEVFYFELFQVYKIRRENPNSVVTRTLGMWGPKSHFDKISPFIPVEGRQDLMGFPLIVGMKNWTYINENAAYTGGKSIALDTDVDDTENLIEIMNFIAMSLNATIQYVSFMSTGTEVQEGVWSELLGAVVKGDVDFGLEKVTVSYHKSDFMAFTYNIMKMSHNLYMHPSEFSVSKDIYLTPFSPKLLLCVLGMSLLLAIIMFTISAVADYKAKRSKTETETITVSYASLWTVGIMSMQGSIWTPASSSGNITLIASLMFALLIYNSYAAFITSILSVKTSDINSLDDLFENGYKVGYIRDSQDENYLQKETGDLKNIYLRGYNSKVDTIDEGLLLAARTKYALFVSTQAARRAIQVLAPYECRCQIQEFSLKSTVEDIAFPLNKSSPYLKLINLGVLRMIESGTLSRIEGYMLPDMPTCSSDSSFVSAQLEDVFTAVKLLLCGIVLSIIIAIGECVVKYRISLKYNLKHGFYKSCIKIRTVIRNFEF